MTKGLIITHGNLGHELVAVAETILEQKLDILPICFDWTSDGAPLTRELEEFIRRHKNDHIIIFTDMFGGSPANISSRYIGPRVEVVTGINLPGLLKFASFQNKNADFREIVRTVQQGTLEGISVISEYLGVKS
jgi:PTS system mannose-specific IIA component